LVQFSFAQKGWFEKKEAIISQLSQQIFKSTSDKEKVQLNDQMTEELYEVLSHKKSSRYPFSNLKHISIIQPDDKAFRMFTWSVKLGNNKFVYGGVFHYYDKSQRAQVVHVLRDMSSKINNVEDKSLSTDFWFGALYYKVIKKEFNGLAYYTLLGWDGHDDRSEKKIVDVLWFDRAMKPYFGAPIFVSKRGIKNRFILEYNELSKIRLNYQEKLGVIFFDHLEPVDGTSYNVPSCFVPTSDVDGMIFKQGKWSMIYQLDVEKLK
jgi:hypothetical protein